jgi:serine/threonine protein kinase
VLATGSRIAGYRVEEFIGRGGMGLVYRATQLTLDRQVALKLIAPELAEDSAVRERFLRESRVAASIDHPNLIPIYEADEADGVLFIAMRYVDGSDLRTVLAGARRLGLQRVGGIVAQVAAALDAAHAHGLVHRDVKPANVLVSGPEDREHVYLSDFANARGEPRMGFIARSTSRNAAATAECRIGARVLEL